MDSNKEAEIQPINKETVHRICSGQVILTLAVAVKELVENALDAGATNIEIRLKNYGNDFVEVADNGSGVQQKNFGALTLKHYTSKINKFTDLESLTTLGFRGEALSSLCALSDLAIVTRHSSAPHAIKIEYDHNGSIKTETPAARDVGTTVTLSNLFSSLPVRRKELTKNVKREYGKMCQLLYAYCLVSKGVKFSCINQTESGSRNTVVTTSGLGSVKDNIILVFGAKQAAPLVEVELVEPDEAILQEYGLELAAGDSIPFSIECYISSATHGSGRSTSDRQFFYINSRPCEPHKVIKLVNAIYKRFNSNQYPFVYLNILMERSKVDVNVTPDKRQVFVSEEKLLSAVIKRALLEAFKHCPSTLTSVASCSLKRPFKSESGTASSRISDIFGKRAKTDTSLGAKEDKNKCESSEENISSTQERLDTFLELSCKYVKKKDKNEQDRIAEVGCDVLKSLAELNSKIYTATEIDEELPSNREVGSPNETNIEIESSPTQTKNAVGNKIESLTKTESDASFDLKNSSTEMVDEEEQLNGVLIPSSNPAFVTELLNIAKKSIKSSTMQKPLPQCKSVTIDASIETVKRSLNRIANIEDKSKLTEVKFRSQISVSENEKAETELQKQFSKDKFAKMDIIGQFNLGFIIAKLDDDLFIIDQHATDEKYNFEDLQRSTILDQQALVSPKPLELTAANESLLIDNEDLFRKNGFSFKIDPNAPATKKVSLTAIPVSRNYKFGKDDIDEMLFMLQEDANSEVCRPSRIRAMFASRACRKSVMIGCPLTKTDMKRLVMHMGEIEQPWNCPHGRPTMRHLVNLGLIQGKTD